MAPKKKPFCKTHVGRRLAKLKTDLHKQLQRYRVACAGTERTVSQTLWNLLTSDERRDILQLARKDAGTQSEQQALVVQELVQEHASGSSSQIVQRALVASARSVLGKKNKVKAVLNVEFGRRLWRSAAAKRADAKVGGRPSKTNDPAIFEMVRKYLLDNSTITAHYMKVNKELTRVYSLSRSKRKLWKLNPDIRKKLSMSSWLRHLRKHHKHFKKFKKLVDVCPICHKYDKLVVPKVTRGVREALSKIKKVEEKYFGPMDTFWIEMQKSGRADPATWNLITKLFYRRDY